MVPLDELETDAQRSRKRKLLVVAVLVGALIAFGLLRPAPDQPDRLPNFELPALAGNGTLSSSDFEGKPMVINFWASWCIPCREEMPLLEKTYRQYRDSGVEFLGVNTRDDPADALAFLEEVPVSYAMVRDPDQRFGRQLDVSVGLPQTIFVDADGRIVGASNTEETAPESTPRGLEIRTGRGAILGAISKEELEAQIDALLESSDG